MNKLKIIWYGGFLIVYLMTWLILHYVFKNLEAPYKGMISAVLAGLLSPRTKEYETQSGTQTQVKWLFLKKTITI